MKNFMAMMGVVALLALPVILVTAPASVSAEVHQGCGGGP